MARTPRGFSICSQRSSDEDLNAPPKVPISSRGRVVKEREGDLDGIETIQQLTLAGSRVIKLLCECDALVVTEPKAARARETVEQFRRETLNHSQSISTERDETAGLHSQPFDRLIYLLDRYTEYCTAIGLSAWPIHHLKVAIWIKGDVISLKTRVIPLRKTVRCYITTMETVRVKTRHVFYPPHEPDHKPLLTRPILKELLDVLPISRSSSHHTANPEEDHIFGGLDRSTVLKMIRAKSGDSLSQDALALVQAARESTGRDDGFRYGKKKPDPHLHTLSRYMAFCRSLPVPVWPIEPLRVSLWLRESVIAPASPEYYGYKVSLRTVQVYLSRLEYSRLKTEVLFKSPFGELATGSLYRSQVVGDILESFNPNHEKKFGFLTQSLRSEESSDYPTVLGKRKHLVNSLLQEANRYQNHKSPCRPKTSSSRSSLVISASEDSRSDSATSFRRRSSSFNSVWSESSTTSCAERESCPCPVSQTKKGCLSYILCSEESRDSPFPVSKDRYHSTLEPASITEDCLATTRWEISPLSVPRSQNCQPRIAIPSFATFDFALSHVKFQ